MSEYIDLGIRFIFQEWSNRSRELLNPPTMTEGWFLMESPFIPLGICGVYLALIFHFHYGSGTSSSIVENEHQEQLNIKDKGQGTLKGSLAKGHEHNWILPSLQVYNLFNVAMNFFIAAGLTWVIIKGKYSIYCEKVRDITDDQDSGDLLAPLFVYLFHISKIIELGDTAFIIVREKWRQLTFLHVYHHTTILCATWVGTRVVPGGTTAIISMINCWIHVIMYSYYKSKSTSHHHQNLILKKLITIVQILQFVTTIWIGLMTLQWPCGFPYWVAISLILYMLTFVLLFGHFYVATYV